MQEPLDLAREIEDVLRSNTLACTPRRKSQVFVRRTKGLYHRLLCLDRSDLENCIIGRVDQCVKKVRSSMGTLKVQIEGQGARADLAPQAREGFPFCFQSTEWVEMKTPGLGYDRQCSIS